MDDRMTAEYTATVAEAVARLGTGVGDRENIYGWQDHEAIRHIKGYDRDEKGKSFYNPAKACKWVVPADPEIEEDIISEFTDTFNGNDDTAVINLFHVSCACGAYQNRTVRYAGTVEDFIPELFRSEVEENTSPYDYYGDDYNPYD